MKNEIEITKRINEKPSEATYKGFTLIKIGVCFGGRNWTVKNETGETLRIASGADRKFSTIKTACKAIDKI